MAEPELWAALAIAPIDADAVRARDEIWDVSRRSLRLAMVVTLLIFLTVPTIYLTESFVPLLIGGPLIVIAALYGAFRAIGPGGEISQSYERTDRAMEPLGLQVSERPRAASRCGCRRRPASTTGCVAGPCSAASATAARWRYGWAATKTPAPARSTSAARVPEFERPLQRRPGASAGRGAGGDRGGAGGDPQLDPLEAARGRAAAARGSSSPARRGEQGDWLCDLWLAERLAAA